MNVNLKTSLSGTKTLLIISLLSLLAGILSCVLGEILLPVLIGLLAIVYLFDNYKFKPFALFVSTALLIINLVGVLMGLTLTLFAPSSIILAIILAYRFNKRANKSDCAYLMTFICALFSLVSYFLLAMVEKGEFTFEAVKVFYSEMYSSLRGVFVENMMSVYNASGVQVTEEMIGALLDAQVDLITSYLLIGGFITVGIGIKLFCFAVSKLVDDKKSIAEWRFESNSIFAYSYFVLSLASVFVSLSDSQIAIPILNLYNLFLVIFAYIGFNVAISILSIRMKSGVAILIVIALLLVFSSFSIQLLAVLGAMFTIKNNKFKARQN